MLFNNIKSKAEQFSTRMSQNYNDPSRIGDERAFKVSWQPVNVGGNSGFINLNKLKPHHNYLIIKSSLVSRIIFIGLVTIGCIGIYNGIYKTNPNFILENFTLDFFKSIFVWIIFVTVGIVLFFMNSKLIRIDKSNGVSWRGNKLQAKIDNHNNTTIPNSKIISVQLLKEWKKDSYSYELNLVLKNNERRHLTHYGNLNKLREDGSTIAHFLKIPLWDAIID